MTRLRVLGVLCVLGLGAACGGGSKAMVPVDSPIQKWQAPTEEELTGEAAKKDGDDDWGSEEAPAEPEKSDKK